MKKIFSLFFLFFITNSYAVDPRLDWQTIETTHFYIHFAKGYSKLANKTAKLAEAAHNKLSPIIAWEPEEKTHLVISDETDQPNGYAIPFPFNRSVLFVAPPDTTNSLEDYDDWLDTLITHEYTHILHLDKVAGGPGKLRNIFGRHYLLFPNVFQPVWLIEGLAVYHETDLEKNIGRGQSSLFQMMMRMEVASGIKPVSQVNLPIRSWPMGTSFYLYGVHFYQFIEDRYGKHVIEQLVENYSHNIIPFMINTNTEDVLNKDVEALWQEFSEWLEEKYKTQIDNIENQGLIEGKAITENGYFTGAVQVLADGSAYYVRNGAFNYPALMLLDEKGKHHEVAELHSGARIDVHKDAGVLIAQPEYCEEYNQYYDLYIIKPGEDEARAITSCGRYRSAAWSPDGEKIVAVHTDKSISQLQILNKQGKKLSTIWQGKDNEVIGQPDWSPDGRYIVAAIIRESESWNIEQYDLHTQEWKKITSDEHVNVQPRYSEDNSSIIFSSDRTGVYNIYQYDLRKENIQQLTRVKSGAFSPSMNHENGSLYYVGYGANGTDIMVLDNVNQFSTDVEKPQSTKQTLNKENVNVEISEASEYSPWPSLKIRWWEPYLFLDEDQTEFGFSTVGNDALGIHNYGLLAAYDSENQWFIGNLSYRYSNRLLIGIQRSTDILTNANGDFLYAIKEDDAFASIIFPQTKFDYSFNFYAGVFTSRDSVGRKELIAPALLDSEDNILGLALTFDNSEQYIRSVSKNDGRSIKLIAESSDVIDSSFTGEVFTIDWREFIPLGGQHVLALRLVEAYGTDSPDPLRLGGEDSDVNFFDILEPVGEPIFGQREYALRGYKEGLPQLRGRRMQLASLEYRFPLDLVERGIMAPPVGLIQYSGSVFVDTGGVWQTGGSPDKYYTGVGIEFHADVNFFYGINLRARLGIATGLDDLIGDDRAYISLGTSF